MRQIAERLLPDGVGTTYVDGEIVGQKVKTLKPLNSGHHVYCSALNLGAIELMAEVSLAKNITMQLDSQGQNQETNTLYVTTQAGCMARCDHMVLYLTGRTWTRGAASRSLGEEVMRAMDDGIHILLAHEMTGAGGQETRFGCEFGDFFGHPDGATPHELLKRGIYSEIAVPLKGGAWREASMMLLAMALGMSKEQIVASKAGEDVLGLDEATVAWVGTVLKESPQQFIRKSTRSFRIALGANKSTRTTVAISVSETSASAADVQDSGIERPSRAAMRWPFLFGTRTQAHSFCSTMGVWCCWKRGQTKMHDGVETHRPASRYLLLPQ